MHAMLLSYLLIVLPIFTALFQTTSGVPLLKVGFYRSSCPPAERIVRKAVSNALARNPGLAAGLIRMHFHDCFVNGCDASILLDSHAGIPSEKEHIANPTLRGFEVIDKAKSEIEARCPKTVSCSDILAFAARDSASIVGSIWYTVPSGRRDGKVSREVEVGDNLPGPFSNVKDLKEGFAGKGLSLTEMVALSGAHSIGVSQCSMFSNRLYTFNSTHPQDPSMDPKYAAFLKTKCPNPQTGRNSRDPLETLDYVTPNRLDNQYYKNLVNNRGLLSSDQALMSSKSTARIVMKYMKNRTAWEVDFAASMVHMGTIDVLTGNKGEIRRHCRAVN